ncbi:MAG: rhomboid family intramembrane serine protease [Shimia sp.]
MSDTAPDPAPFNALPPLVWALAAALMLPELVFQLASAGVLGGPSGIGWRVGAIEDFGFFPRAVAYMIETRTAPPDWLMRFVTYPFVHGGMLHALFVGAFVLALGKFVGEAMGGLVVVVTFLAASVGGALLYGLFVNGAAPLIGGFPGAYGLIGAFSFLFMLKLEEKGANQLGAFRLIGLLMAIQLVFGALFGGPPTWVADLAGAALGFAVAAAFMPGSWLGRIRRD